MISEVGPPILCLLSLYNYQVFAQNKIFLKQTVDSAVQDALGNNRGVLQVLQPGRDAGSEGGSGLFAWHECFRLSSCYRCLLRRSALISQPSSWRTSYCGVRRELIAAQPGKKSPCSPGPHQAHQARHSLQLFQHCTPAPLHLHTYISTPTPAHHTYTSIPTPLHLHLYIAPVSGSRSHQA